MDKTLRATWAKAANEFIAANPRDYGEAPSVGAIENFLDNRIGDRFATAVMKASLTLPEVRTKIDGLLDKAISEARQDITPLRKNVSYKIATGLKNTIDQMAVS